MRATHHPHLPHCPQSPSQVQGSKLTAQPRSKFPTSGTYGAAAAGDGGSPSAVEPSGGGPLGGAARELLSQLVATNPRRSVTDATALVTERLTDRSFLLDNPTARVKLNKMFLRWVAWGEGEGGGALGQQVPATAGERE